MPVPIDPAAGTNPTPWSVDQGQAVPSAEDPQEIDVDAGAAAAPPVVVERHGAAMVLALSGDLDFVTTPTVRDSLLDVLAKRPALVVIDLLGIRFLGSAGLALLAEAAHLRWPDTTLRVAAAGHAARTIQTTGLDSLVGLAPSVASALAAHQR